MTLKQASKMINSLCEKGIFEKIWYGSYKLTQRDFIVVGKRKNKDDAQRFWEKVDKTDQCWNWIGPKKSGYGLFKLNNKSLRAHRISWEMAHGKIPDGLQVLHRCDNPSCVNPNHLFIGTIQDNVKDMMDKLPNSKNVQCYRCNYIEHNESKIMETRCLSMGEDKTSPFLFSHLHTDRLNFKRIHRFFTLS